MVPNPSVRARTTKIGVRHRQRRIEQVKEVSTELHLEPLIQIKVLHTPMFEASLFDGERKAVAGEIAEPAGRSIDERSSVQVHAVARVRITDQIDADSIAANVERLAALPAEDSR